MRRYLAVKRAAATVAALVLLGAGAAACGSDGPSDTLDAFLSGWKSGDLSKVGFVNAAGSPIKAADVSGELNKLAGDLPLKTMLVSRAGDTEEKGTDASGRIKLDWRLPNDAAWTWTYESVVRMTKRDSDGWRVVWEPAVVHKDLVPGDKLTVRRDPAARAAIVDATGKPLVAPAPVVTVAVDPAQVTDAAALVKDLTAAFKKIKVDAGLGDLPARITKAQKGARVDVITIRRNDYAKIRDDIRPLDGTIFEEGTRQLAPTRQFARALLGTVDLATAEDIDAGQGRVAQGDWLGHGGLQQRYDSQLRGATGLSVVVARPTDADRDAVATLYSTPPSAGQPVKVTLDRRVQLAADASIAGVKQPSALVALKVSDGSVLAVTHGPDGGGDNVAFTGQVPPGSTFKMVSALGLLQKKAVTPDTEVACPRTKAVAGRSFKNANDFQLGRVPFRTDFAKSCNTAFVELAPKLGADGLQQAAQSLGLGGTWDLGTPAFTGKPSPGDSPAELAAAAFGQGRTVVSPLAMASATAAVARGKFVQPRLVTSPPPTAVAQDGDPIDAAAVGPLRTMMREVVTSGTGTALRQVPGAPVYAKTGTAEFADDSKDTHSWLVAWQGDVAVAVMVQKGGSGADAALPIAQKFLTTLN